GAWLDVARSRRTLMAFDLTMAVAALAGVLLLAGHGPQWALPLVSIGYGVTSPLSMGAFRSVLPELVGSELWPRANTLEATSVNLAYISGPALAGAIAGAVGPAVAVEVQMGLFVAT